MRLALIVAMPFLGALLPILLARSSRRVSTVGTALTALTGLIILLTHAPEVLSGQTVEFTCQWVPQLGMNFDLRLDGLALLMAGLILSIGILIIIYAKYYLAKDEPVGVFYTYLLLFQGAMVGISLSNNALCLLVFWELTSLASFLLIGFWKHLPAGRQGARMALLVTGGGGLALTAGMLLLGQVAGSYRLDEIIANSNVVKASPWYPLILGLVALGCFTKSAQFPFQFWLPRAMAAPTPVSAYLHSATMVKAGVFLLARLWPALSGTDWWSYLITSTGLITMLVGSTSALFKSDLKAMMAYSTVSHLGLMTMMLGWGTQAGVIACLFHLLNHAIFKAALFMNVGIIDHGTGTREIARLGGLWKWMPMTSGVALLALAANAGIPPLNGFISKELLLEEAWQLRFMGQPAVMAVLITLASLFAVAYSLRFFVSVYMGDDRRLEHTPHAPGAGLAFSSTLLAIVSLAIGLFPGPLAEPLIQSAVDSCLATAEHAHVHLNLWHGMNPAVYSSIVALMLGLVLYNRFTESQRLWKRFFDVDGKNVFDHLVDRTVVSCQRFTNLLQNGVLPNYLAVMLAATMAITGLCFVTSTWHTGERPMLPVNLLSLTLTGILLAASLATVAYHRQRILSLMATNVVGLITCIGFIYLSAPDLALTQISVEVVTLILILLAMFFLPRQSPVESSQLRLWRDGSLALVAGLGMTGLTWAVLRIDMQRHLATYFIDQSKPAGGGANVVNVILVDFRGFDTFSEVAVLSASALIIYALLDGMMHGAWSHQLRQWVPDHHRTPEKHPKLMMIPSRVMLPMALLVAAYIFLRGHNDPGGGFVAGLMVTIALVVQYMVSSYKWADERIHVDAHAWIAMGLLLVTGTSAAAMVMGYPFLTNAHGHLQLPVLGDVGISSAMSFDAGVLMAVVGSMMLILANLARLGPKAKSQVTPEPSSAPTGGEEDSKIACQNPLQQSRGEDLQAGSQTVLIDSLPARSDEKPRAVPQNHPKPVALPVQASASLIGQPNPFLDKDG